MKKLYIPFLIFLLFVSCKEKIEVPTIITSKVLSVDFAEATVSGELVNEGTAAVTSKGVCWSTSHNPTITDSKTQESTSERFFVSKLNNLDANTTYYVRAYAISSAGVGYGAELSFTTKELVFASIDISSPENITSGYIERIRAEITADGGSPITECGFVWDTKREPTLENASIKAVLEGSKFFAKIDDLIPDSTYFIRAYAKNSKGVSYSTKYHEIKMLSVASQIQILKSDSISHDFAALSMKAISADRANLITKVGVYWSLEEDKVLQDNFVIAEKGDNENEYLLRMSELIADTIYYLHPFAQNKYGEKIGESFTFRTDKEATEEGEEVDDATND